MTAYLIASSATLAILGCLWRRSNLVNFLIKIGLFGLAGWGGFIAFQMAGYIVKWNS